MSGAVAPVIVVICAWHKDDTEIPEGAIVSHGICPGCSDIVMAEAEELLKEGTDA